ncbi:hypothetical protein [Paenisporosarcina sp. NPDC076898]|uniref:hypothetical protein n=1 Tax=unclassified Paenisporosarcina TaxID=2642018 RepID=UPI003CFF7120
MVDINTFDYYVAFLKENDPNGRPTFTYEHYDYSGSHATLGRCLIIHFNKSHPEVIDDAIQLLNGAVEKMFEEKYEDGKIDFDQVIWGYNDLAVWHANYKKDMEKALHFANKGIEMLQTVADCDLSFGVRGQLWFNRWVSSLKLGREEAMLKVCREKITEASLRNSNYTSNSMLYYGYQFLAFVSKSHNDMIQAIGYLEESVKYLDLQVEVRKYQLKQYHEILELKESDPDECYKQLEQLLDMVSSLHQAWDFDSSIWENS